jgi:glycosyltransferase involved in cell wall biosynthesis
LRILLTSNASYLPPRGGSTRSNLAFLQTLVASGHSCRVVAASPEVETEDQRDRLRQELQEQQLDSSLVPKLSRDRLVTCRIEGIELVSVHDLLRRPEVLKTQILDFGPEWILVSSEDLSHTLLRRVHRAAPGRLVYLAHTPQWFPFGPASWNRDEEATQILRDDAAAIVVISKAMEHYVEEYLGRRGAFAHPPLYGQGPWPVLSQPDGYVGMINPCGVKGISIFLAVADLMPHLAFAALPGWGTTRQDLQNLKKRRNITILPHVRDIERFLDRLSVLLMPSLWLEGFGLIVMEAMLRGVPVISTDSGGLREAKAGTPFLIPVNTIERYEPVYDDRHMPRPVLPAQSIELWIKALDEITGSAEAYRSHVASSRNAALEFVTGIDRTAPEKILSTLTPADAVRLSTRPDLSQLSDARRKLMLKKFRERASS